jgi:hypothetical protein
MRGGWITVLALALWGCGAHSALQTASGGTGSGGSATTFPSFTGRFSESCAPTDGPAFGIDLDGSSSCELSTLPTGGVQFLVWGSDLDSLETGAATLTVGGDVNAFTQGYRVLSGSVTQVTGGTLTISTYTAGQSATGSYDVTLADGSAAQGTFHVVWCPGGGQCG